MDKVTTVESITHKEFFEGFVNPGQPLLIRNMTADWNAIKMWDADYFRTVKGDLQLAPKTEDIVSGRKTEMNLSQYVELLENYEQQIKDGEHPPKPPYLHDVPIFHLLPSLVKDITPFPLELLPKWYRHNWHNYIQFFMGATGNVTPLHFDTLYTNNLFFQVIGRKKFILIPSAQKELCYINGWRWSKFDPSKPDYEKYPRAKEVQPIEVILEQGDILFMPSGMLHQVHSLSYSISFNIDWHTVRTARKGVLSFFEGAPRKNVYYNFLIWLGVTLNVPPSVIFPYYKSYLNYVS